LKIGQIPVRQKLRTSTAGNLILALLATSTFTGCATTTSCETLYTNAQAGYVRSASSRLESNGTGTTRKILSVDGAAMDYAALWLCVLNVITRNMGGNFESKEQSRSTGQSSVHIESSAQGQMREL